MHSAKCVPPQCWLSLMANILYQLPVLLFLSHMSKCVAGTTSSRTNFRALKVWVVVPVQSCVGSASVSDEVSRVFRNVSTLYRTVPRHIWERSSVLCLVWWVRWGVPPDLQLLLFNSVPDRTSGCNWVRMRRLCFRQDIADVALTSRLKIARRLKAIKATSVAGAQWRTEGGLGS